MKTVCFLLLLTISTFGIKAQILQPEKNEFAGNENVQVEMKSESIPLIQQINQASTISSMQQELNFSNTAIINQTGNNHTAQLNQSGSGNEARLLAKAVNQNEITKMETIILFLATSATIPHSFILPYCSKMETATILN